MPQSKTEPCLQVRYDSLLSFLRTFSTEGFKVSPKLKKEMTGVIEQTEATLRDILVGLDESLNLHLCIRSNLKSLDESMRRRIHAAFLIDFKERWKHALDSLEADILSRRLNLGTNPVLKFRALAAAAMEAVAEAGVKTYVATFPAARNSTRRYLSWQIATHHSPQSSDEVPKVGPDFFPPWLVKASNGKPEELWEYILAKYVPKFSAKYRLDWPTTEDIIDKVLFQLLKRVPKSEIRNLESYVYASLENEFNRFAKSSKTGLISNLDQVESIPDRSEEEIDSELQTREENFLREDSDLSPWQIFQQVLNNCDAMVGAWFVATEVDEFPPRVAAQKVYLQLGPQSASKSEPSTVRFEALKKFHAAKERYLEAHTKGTSR